MKCPNDGIEMLMFKKPIPVLHLFDLNLLDCDWEGWDEGRLGWLAGICPECNFILGKSPPEEDENEEI